MSLARRLIGLAAVGSLLISPALVPPSASAEPLEPATAPKTHTVGVGSNPYAVAIAQNLGKAFVVNGGSISVVSLLTHRELAQFNTSFFQNQSGIALVRNNTKGYITNGAIKTVAVFDTETHKVRSRIRVGYGAVAIVTANTPKGERAYLITSSDAGPGPGKAKSELIGIQTSTGKVVSRTRLPEKVLGALAVQPGGKRIWVASLTVGGIYQVSTTNGKVAKTLQATKAGPLTGLTFAPKGKVWLTGMAGVSVINAASGKSLAFLTAPKVFSGPWIYPKGVVLNNSGSYAVVANSVENDSGSNIWGALAAINTKTYKVSWRVRTGSFPEGMALDRARSVLYITNYDDDTVTYLPIKK